MQLTLPKIKPINGQCLPAAVACLMNDKTILSKPNAKPKPNGFPFTDLRHFVDGFEIVYASEHAIGEEEFFNFFNYDDFEDYELIPLFVSEPNHAFLLLYDPNELWCMWFDLLRTNCGESPLESFLEIFSITRIACLIDNEDSAILTCEIDQVPHLIKFKD
jgi:hypothetical protein